ncbi:MAG: hypothetical protein QXW05_04805 [Ignisphaera sp.]|uniref:Uncharacterized protein n=1 Tax=Ignisphaera aggregans TaxID=334771 RepID=A0A7C4D0G3_9CREN
MNEETIKLIVIGTRPEDIVRCIIIASKARKYVRHYANVHIFLASNSKGFSGIAVEDEVFVECIDEEESLEQIIDGISRVVSKRKFIGVPLAAGVTDEEIETW